MADNKNLVTHFNKLLEALRLVGGKGFLDMETFEVELRLGEKAHRFYPQFRMRRGEGAVLTPAFFPLVNRFVGWRPYSLITDFSFTEKLTFKKLLTQHQIATPEYSTDPNSGMTNVVVKKEGLSFSQGMKGPFRSARECKIDGKEGEFYERFIPGQIVKIFYWNDRPVSIELRDMPNVVGDGRSTILELIEKKPFRREGKKRPLETVTSVVAFHGKNLSTVLPENETQIIDYRYSSEYDSPRIEDIDLLTVKHPHFDAPLRRVGEVLWKVLQQEGYSAYTYTVDAMLDTQGKLWFLEANSNPANVHPDAYPLMLQWLADQSPQAGARTKAQAAIEALAEQEDLFAHFKKFKEGLRSVGGKAVLDLDTFNVNVQVRQKTHTLYAFFAGAGANRLEGWRPYAEAPAFSFAKKLAFKELLLKQHCPTPEYSVARDSRLTDVMINKEGSSFEQAKGPYRSAADEGIDPQAGEFYEKFIPGRMVKAWFWNHVPVVLQMRETSTTGEGRLRFGEEVEEVELLAPGERPYRNYLWLLGKVLRAALREEGYANAAFTIDAILDADNKLWFLHADPNSTVHPSVYPAMLKDLVEGYPEMRVLPAVRVPESGTAKGSQNSIPANTKTTRGSH